MPKVVTQKPVANNPFVTNTAKETRRFNKGEQNPQNPQNPQNQPGDNLEVTRSNIKNGPPGSVFKMEMYNPTPEPAPKLEASYQQYILESKNPYLKHLLAPTAAYTVGPNYKMPIQQVYNITMPGPTGGHIEMKNIIENILPGKDGKFASTTLGERLHANDYVRQIMLKTHDGEEIGLDSDGHNNLMSYIKLMELNPNHYSLVSSNPYQGLPYGLLIYRSCFPIKYDQKSQSTLCAKDSIGINIRLYALNVAEYYSYHFRQPFYKDYDVWRELWLYEYLKEKIIKKKRCPNFVTMYAYFLSKNNKINYFSLKGNTLTQRELLSNEWKRVQEMQRYQININTNAINGVGYFNRPLTLANTLADGNILGNDRNPDAIRQVVNKLPDEFDESLKKYSGTTLVILTEGPTHNLYQWASREYENDGIVKKMIKHGFYGESTWLSVLFQVVAALNILQLEGIYINDMTIRDNVYVKDLQITGANMGYWKYIINGITYYVPNYGYLAMIDTNFKDIEPTEITKTNRKRIYKLYKSGLGDKKYKPDVIHQKIYDNYKNIINPNNFTGEHIKNNFNKPPEKIMELLGQMYQDNASNNIGDVFDTYFRPFMNNRIGTLLRKDTEIPNIRDVAGIHKIGDLVIETLAADLYKWGVVIDDNVEENKVRILTKNDAEEFIEKEIDILNLRQYSPSEKIEQNYVPGKESNINFSEENLLETYVSN